MHELTIHKITREDQPDRCQYRLPSGQCNNVAIAGSPNCSMHSSLIKPANAQKYKIQLWQDQIDAKAGNPEIKNLRQEIGILQVILEKKLNSCTTETDLLIHAPAINNLILTIEKLVQSCHALDLKMGMLIDKNTILRLASTISDIMAEYVTDSDAREDIAERIMNIIATTVIA